MCNIIVALFTTDVEKEDVFEITECELTQVP